MSRTTVTVGFYGPPIEAIAGALWGVVAGMLLFGLTYQVFGWTATWTGYVIPIVGFIPTAIGVQLWLESKREPDGAP